MFRLLTAAERRRVFLLLPAVTLMALLQVVGIASVLPFLQLVTEPELIETSSYLSATYDLLGFESSRAFLIFTGVAALLMLVMSNAFTAFTEWMLLRFSWTLNHSLAERLLTEYLHKPYTFFLGANSSELIKNMMAEVRQVVQGLVVQGMQLIARAITALFILALLVIYKPLLALVTFAMLGGAYGLIFVLIRRRLSRIGRTRVASNRELFRAATEALSGVKDVKLLGKEKPFIRRFARASRRFSMTMANQNTIKMVPRYALEAIAFGAIIMIVVVMLARGQDASTILPTLGLYGIAGNRLLPALQTIFGSVTTIRFSAAALEVVEKDLEDRSPVPTVDRDTLEPLPFREALELRDVEFWYPDTDEPVLRDFNLRIEPNTSVAFVGSTGSGKTTTVDLLLGLLRPQRGALVVDGREVQDEDVQRWQKNLGYVPQQIYLADDTIEANIAFGVPPKRVERESVERAARLADIHDFILELPRGYDTVVGERGVRLSGGQRQRLGIARALYQDPDVLVLDEATSALDNVTEENIFQAVGDLGRSKTVLMIAHRLSTVRSCDVIYLLDQGRIVAKGSYDELMRDSPAFRALASAAGDNPPARPPGARRGEAEPVEGRR